MQENQTMTLPLLITRGLVVFPKNPQNIDAGRDFSVNAIKEANANTDGLIVVVTQRSPEVEEPEEADIYAVGTLCKITNTADHKKYLRIKANPSARVRILKASKTNDYYVASVEVLADIPGDSKEEMAIIRNVISGIEAMGEAASQMPKTLINQLSKGVSAVDLCDALGSYLPISVEAKQKILETLDVNERLKLILTHLDEEKEIASIDRNIQETVRQSAEKSQKEYYLREKMKAIKKELGEDVDSDKSEETILSKLDKDPYPDYVKAKVKAEFKKYEMMPQASLEASLIKSYIDLVMEVPWFQKTEDNDDLNNVKKILDEDHFGLDKVKKRIVEYLAVKQMTGNLKAPILCFYGPPGVGKTSLGKSIARALNRKFIKASLGGISDEAEIRGHRRTYVGAMPGRIITGMKRAGTVNPVFLLDEVDKLASSYKGDPASALLEVLDPEQNIAFNDNYLEEPYDLSNVLFICTANYIENVPGPLRDRLELIEVNSYTILEKIQIAMNFLVKKELEANGLKSSQISFTEKGITFIIEHYTREAGVRDLERKIASVCRKVVVDIISNPEIKKVTIGEKEVKKYLGVEVFDNSQKEKNNQIGVVTGLAYTEYGGDILPIEVNYFKGKGALILTGKLGDVMKESASIALDYVKANAQKYGIDPDIFGNIDIHIHVPEGAVPKDGPSAGVAITTAIISCLSKRPVSSDVAMTGEVTLRGNALPIGGLREKSLAAMRCGIKTIIVPNENKKSVDELPKEVKEGVHFIFMKTVDDAVSHAIVK